MRVDASLAARAMPRDRSRSCAGAMHARRVRREERRLRKKRGAAFCVAFRFEGRLQSTPVHSSQWTPVHSSHSSRVTRAPGGSTVSTRAGRPQPTLNRRGRNDTAPKESPPEHLTLLMSIGSYAIDLTPTAPFIGRSCMYSKRRKFLDFV